MASRATRASDSTTGMPDDSAAAVAATAVNATAEMARQHMAVAADTLALVFRLGETLQQTQVQMSQRAALLHRQAADNIRKAGSPVELFSIQSSLAVYECQEAMRYWQELLMAGARVGDETLRRAQAEPGSADTVGMGMGAAMNAAAPLMQAWQHMFTAPIMNGAAQARHH